MAIFDFLQPIQEAIQQWLIQIGVTAPPWSGIFLVIVSLLISSITGLLNRALLDMEKLADQNEEMKKHNERKKKAMETADKKLWISVKRNEDRIMDLQRKTMMTRMLPSFITMGPFIFVFNTLRAAFQQTENHVLNWYCMNGHPTIDDYECLVGEARHGVLAILPFNTHNLPLLGSWFSPYALDQAISVAGFSFWYFLCAIVVSTLVQRLFGFNITGMQNPGTGQLGGR